MLNLSVIQILGVKIITLKARYPADVRWTGKPQDLLDEDREIIEEGLFVKGQLFLTKWNDRE